MLFCGWKQITAAAQDMVLGWPITESAIREWAKQGRLQISSCRCGRPHKKHASATLEAIVRAIGVEARMKARKAHRDALGHHAAPQSSELIEVLDPLGRVYQVMLFGRRRLTEYGDALRLPPGWILRAQLHDLARGRVASDVSHPAHRCLDPEFPVIAAVIDLRQFITDCMVQQQLADHTIDAQPA
jgi:hypothetical protein